MGSIIDKIKVATGRDSSHNFDLSCFHGTTASFYAPRVTYFHEVVPGEKWNIDARCSVQALPLIKPSMGDIKVHNRFFYVPYFTIFRDWTAFIAESPVPSGVGQSTSYLPSVPAVKEWTIVSVLHTSNYSVRFTPSSADDVADFVLVNGASQVHYRFTRLGKTVYSILCGLGYQFDLSLTSDNNFLLSAMPILAYLKVYLDWYRNTAFDDKVELEAYLNLGGLDDFELEFNDISKIFSAFAQMYLEKDYFTASSLYPIGTNQSSMQMNHTILDITNSPYASTSVHSDPSDARHGTPYINNSGTASAGPTKYSIDAVNALTDYVKRHQLAGIQPFNRILAEYGVSVSDEELRRSTYIGDNVVNVDIKTIISNSYADDTTLGERAGFAADGSQKHFDFNAGDTAFGCIICVTTVVPRTSYTDGMKRHCLRLDRFDFFTPSIEHLGVEPVLVKELFAKFTEKVDNKPLNGAIFGYMPRYASYKTALDSLSGDFMLNSRSTTFDPWVIRRRFYEDQPSGYNTISEDFTVAKTERVNNLFVDGFEDNFIIFNMWHVNARLPMHALFDDYQWSNEGDNPDHVTIHNQGVQLT